MEKISIIKNGTLFEIIVNKNEIEDDKYKKIWNLTLLEDKSNYKDNINFINYKLNKDKGILYDEANFKHLTYKTKYCLW